MEIPEELAQQICDEVRECNSKKKLVSERYNAGVVLSIQKVIIEIVVLRALREIEVVNL